jgi:tetratricopeptide (TPR) repeat protein
MKKIFFSSAFFLVTFFLFSQKIDSLKNVLINTNSINERIDLLNLLSYEYRTFDLKQAEENAKEARQLLLQNDYRYGLGYSYYVFGTLMMDKGSYDSAIYQLKAALSVMLEAGKDKDLEGIYNNLGISFKRMGKLDSSSFYYEKALSFVTDEYGKGRLFINIGSNYISMGLLDSAAMNQLRAIKIFEELNSDNGLTIAYLNLGNIHYKKEDFDWATKYYKLSLKNAVSSNHKPVQSRCYLNIGSILALKHNYDSALIYFYKAIPIQESMNDQTGLAASYRNLGEVYLNNNTPKLAEVYFLKSNDIYLTVNNLEGQIRINKFLSEFYIETGDFKSAELYANHSVELARDAGILHELQKSLELQHRVFNKIGKYQKAYNALYEEKKLGDSLFSEAKLLQINELQTQYETEKKELQIASLFQQASIKDLEIKQKNQLILIGLITILLIAGIIYFIYRQRAFKNKQSQTELEQRFLRSQLNPHFISNALMAVQNFMLKNESEKASTYLAKFSKLMREILENSRQEFIPVEDEIQMLTNYLDIHRLRMNESFDYKIAIDESIDVETDTIPPMFVQPFIENAIEHGIINAKGQGMINLNLIKEGDYISIEISDNGGGIVHNSSKSAEHNSLSTTIIQERMALFNKSLKKKIQLVWGDIRNENGEINGTKVELKVPYNCI